MLDVPGIVECYDKNAVEKHPPLGWLSEGESGGAGGVDGHAISPLLARGRPDRYLAAVGVGATGYAISLLLARGGPDRYLAAVGVGATGYAISLLLAWEGRIAISPLLARGGPDRYLAAVGVGGTLRTYVPLFDRFGAISLVYRTHDTLFAHKRRKSGAFSTNSGTCVR